MKKVDLIPDERLSQGRRRRVFLQDALGVMQEFTGEDIAGVVKVVGSTYHKNGKWSHTTYAVQIPDGVDVVPIAPRLHQTRSFDGCADYPDVQARTGAPRPIKGLHAWLQARYPKSAARLDELAEQLDELEASDTDCVAHVMGIGVGPFTRARRHLREADINLVHPDGRTAVITCDEMLTRSLTCEWARILEIERTPGQGGGCEIIRIACPEGTTWDWADGA